MRRLNALAPYYGAKRQAARQIVARMGPHRKLWDIMCGSCAVALADEACEKVVINDMNGAVINLARVIASDDLAPLLFDRLYRTAFCEGLYRESVEWLRGLEGKEGLRLDPDWAYHYFVVGWQGRNGLVGTTGELRSGFCMRYGSSGGDPAVRFKNVVENIPAWWEKMRSWTILQEDAIKLCGRIEDREGVVIYADPPYLDKQAEYAHDFSLDTHGRLAEALRRFTRTRVLVSYYDHPLLEDLYLRHGWVKVALDVPKNLSVTTGAKRAPEVLLVNRRER